MRPTLGLFAIVAFLGLSVAGPAFAQLDNGQEQAVVALHAQAHNAKGFPCNESNENLPCGRFTTAWPLREGADVLLVVARADSALGISGLLFRVDYGNTLGVQADGQGCDVFGYLSCSELEFLNVADPRDPSTWFPAAGAGNYLTWYPAANCQRHVVEPWGVQVLACTFYVYAYSPDRFSVNMSRWDPFGFGVRDCAGPAWSDLDLPSHAGYVDFGGGAGYNPCLEFGPVPVESTTWGKLKSQYE
jgi:hypothetical protein